MHTLKKNFLAVKELFQALHKLGRNDRPPDSQMVAGILFCVTNDHLIDLLKYLLVSPQDLEESRKLSKRSSLFDKLIIMKDDGNKPWVLRLHTYQVSQGLGYMKDSKQPKTRSRVSNLGEELQDDEANTHFHRWQ